MLSGDIPAGKLVRQAVERHLKDLEDGENRGLRFDPAAGARAIEFFGYLRHSKAEWAGKPFELSPWQCFILWVLFGWKRREGDGWVRRFREAYIEIPRKNGKSTFASGIGLYLFVADGEGGAEVYTAATKRDQARIVHSEAVRMVKSSPMLKARIGVYKDNLNLGERDLAAKFEPLGADSDTMDGLNLHGAIIDELHAHKNRACLDVLDTATGSRRQPMLVTITTAGSNKESVCGELHDHCEELLTGTRENDRLFAYIATIDKGDEWTDPKVWTKANPNYGVSVKASDLEAKVLKAKAIPSARNEVLRKHLNVWTETDEVWIPQERWDECRADKVLGRPLDWTEFEGTDSIVGLDLSSKLDLTALGQVFKHEELGYAVRFFFWLPEARLADHRANLDYRQWVEDGFIETTPGNVVDYEFIEKRIVELSGVREVCFDPWNATSTATRLKETHGIEVVEFRQGYASMNEPSKEFEKLVTSKAILHDGNPVMRWMIGNCSVKTDPAGNIKPAKPENNQARKKIDGVVAAVMGLGRWLVTSEADIPFAII